MNQAKPMSLMDFVAAARAQVKEVAPAELQTMLETTPDLLLVDVRESSEHEQGHIRNAHLVPRGIIEAAADTQYPKRDEMLSTARERPVVLYCATGGRSAMAAATLQMMGFKDVYSLAGGFMKWQESDLPVVREARFV
ncbi:MAG: rhodanese-like domain-containing protein [Gammaproteobacteria bacterium]